MGKDDKWDEQKKKKCAALVFMVTTINTMSAKCRNRFWEFILTVLTFSERLTYTKSKKKNVSHEQTAAAATGNRSQQAYCK